MIPTHKCGKSACLDGTHTKLVSEAVGSVAVSIVSSNSTVELLDMPAMYRWQESSCVLSNPLGHAQQRLIGSGDCAAVVGVDQVADVVL